MNIEELFKGEESFIKVAKHYYNKNFGTMTKSDFELLMFTILYEKLDEKKKNVTSISLALDLGITVTKVDNLLEKMMLKKSEAELALIPWRETLSSLLEGKTECVTYNATDKNFSLIIDDRYVQYKAMEILRKNDLYFQELSKPRGLILSEAAFAALAYECCDVKKKKTFEDAVNAHLKQQDIAEVLNGQNVGKALLSVGREFLLSSVKTLLSDKAAEALEKLIDAGEAQVKKGMKKDK